MHYVSPKWKRKRGRESIFEEIMTQNFTNLREKRYIQIQGALVRYILGYNKSSTEIEVYNGKQLH